MLPMRFASNHAGMQRRYHCAISLPPTLREKHAKDGAPTS